MAGLRQKMLRTAVAAVALILGTLPVRAADMPEIRFLIPGGKGGGWDTTAHAVGEVLTATGLANVVAYENLVGGGGERALLDLIHHPQRHRNTLMVQSTPIIVRSFRGDYRNSWRDTRPVAILISAYQAIAVPANSPYRDINELMQAIRLSPGDIPVTGGSTYLSLDHLTLGLVAQAAGIHLNALRYSPADGGKAALDRLLSGKVKAVVSGVGELLPAAQAGKIRILGVTSADPLPGLEVPTFRSQGLNVVFSNWRGFFAASATDEKDIQAFEAMFTELAATTAWANQRSKYRWEPLLLVGDPLKRFLIEQERSLFRIMTMLQSSPERFGRMASRSHARHWR